MNNFTYDIKTKVYFGKGQISHLGEETALYGKKSTSCIWWRKHQKKWTL